MWMWAVVPSEPLCLHTQSLATAKLQIINNYFIVFFQDLTNKVPRYHLLNYHQKHTIFIIISVMTFCFNQNTLKEIKKIVIQYFDLTSYSRTMKKHSQEKFKYSLYKDQYLCAFYLKLLLIIKFIQTRIFSFGVSCLKSGAKVIQLKSKWYYYSFILQIQGHSIKSNLFFDLRYDRKNILKSVLASVPPNIPTYTKITVKNFEKSIYFQLFCDFFVSTKSKEKAFRTLHLSQNFLRCSKIVQKRKNYCTIF
eukprot:TRINITY_DN10952_c1_g1_i3.p1 TRINITY_DN10952_c1_g1~~TRINITY_DN10952_c1_g1_i3.p1  ORF type:complete len:260 (+),score=-3.93 TRINITY_DN10952_c1_g1_i3:29-781(+)